MIIGYKEISIALAVADKTAQKRLTEIKLALGKLRKNKLTIDEFCHYERLPKDYVMSMLKPQRK